MVMIRRALLLRSRNPRGREAPGIVSVGSLLVRQRLNEVDCVETLLLLSDEPLSLRLCYEALPDPSKFASAPVHCHVGQCRNQLYLLFMLIQYSLGDPTKGLTLRSIR